MLFLFLCAGSVFRTLHKRSFAEVSKNLTRCRSLKIILFDHQNNYVERLNVHDNVAKSFAAKTF